MESIENITRQLIEVKNRIKIAKKEEADLREIVLSKYNNKEIKSEEIFPFGGYKISETKDYSEGYSDEYRERIEENEKKIRILKEELDEIKSLADNGAKTTGHKGVVKMQKLTVN